MRPLNDEIYTNLVDLNVWLYFLVEGWYLFGRSLWGVDCCGYNDRRTKFEGRKKAQFVRVELVHIESWLVSDCRERIDGVVRWWGRAGNWEVELIL